MEQIVQDKIWDYYQNEKKESFANAKSRLLYLAKLAKKSCSSSEEKLVLNIGVGDGLFEVLAFRLGLQIFSLDPNSKTIENIKNKLSFIKNYNIRAKVGYIESVPFSKNFFDVVVVSELLEHLSNDSLSLAILEIKRILKPGGILIGSVPARETLDNLNVFCPNCGSHFHVWGHQQSFDISRMKAVLKDIFDVKEIFEKYFISGGLNWKGKIVSGLKLVLNFFKIKGSGENIIFIVKKK